MWDKVPGQLPRDSLRPALSAPNSTVSLFVSLAIRPWNNLLFFFWKAQLTPFHLIQEDPTGSAPRPSPRPSSLPLPPSSLHTASTFRFHTPQLHSRGCFFVCLFFSLTLVYKNKHHTHPSVPPSHTHRARPSKGPIQHRDNKAGVVTGKLWPKASTQGCPLRQMASSGRSLPGGTSGPGTCFEACKMLAC